MLLFYITFILIKPISFQVQLLSTEETLVTKEDLRVFLILMCEAMMWYRGTLNHVEVRVFGWVNQLAH